VTKNGLNRAVLTNVSLAVYTNRFKAGDWISKRNSGNNTTLEWIYHVTGVTPNTVQVIEFQRVTHTGLIKVANSQVIILSPEGITQSGSSFKKVMEAHIKLPGSSQHSPSPLYSGFSNLVSLMGFLGIRESGTGKPPSKWVTLFFLAILQSGVIETQGTPPTAFTSAPSFKA
jgi:hypothetical protein